MHCDFTNVWLLSNEGLSTRWLCGWTWLLWILEVFLIKWGTLLNVIIIVTILWLTLVHCFDSFLLLSTDLKLRLPILSYRFVFVNLRWMTFNLLICSKWLYYFCDRCSLGSPYLFGCGLVNLSFSTYLWILIFRWALIRKLIHRWTTWIERGFSSVGRFLQRRLVSWFEIGHIAVQDAFTDRWERILSSL